MSQHREMDALGGLTDVRVNRLPDHAIGPIGEVFLKLLGEREILRLQRLVMKLPWRESLNGTRPLTLLSIGLQSISTTEFEEEFALPRVVQTADHDDIQPLGTLSSQTGSVNSKARRAASRSPSLWVPACSASSRVPPRPLRVPP